MLRSAYAAILAALTLIAPSLASAQDRNVEIGIDAAGLSWTRYSNVSTSGDETRFDVPIGVRAGAFLSPHVSLETSIGFIILNRSGAPRTFASLRLQPALLYHFADPRHEDTVFLGASGLIAASGTSEEFDAHFGFRGVVGVKLPIADRFGARVDGFVNRFYLEEDITSTSVGLELGFSVFI